jgi:hypothetical protein
MDPYLHYPGIILQSQKQEELSPLGPNVAPVCEIIIEDVRVI